jgi:hypothetical protein
MIIAARHEINKSAISQILKLLTYLGSNVLVAGVEIAEMALEGIDLVQGKIALTQRLHALHDVQ